MKKHFLILSAVSLCFSVARAQLTFTPVSNVSSIAFSGGDSEIEVADIDGDGDLDIATIGDHGSGIGGQQAGVMVFKNSGDGIAWSTVKSGNFGYGGIAIGDVNNDGKNDVGFAMHHQTASGFGSKYMEVGLGDGTGSNWTAWDTDLSKELDPNDPNTWGMFGSDFGDVNNDGNLDMASISFGCCDGLRIYNNKGNGSWSAFPPKSMGNVLSSGYCMFGDFNNDGNLDLSASGQGGLAFKNDGLGNFSSMSAGIPSDWTNKFDIGDVNNDGAKDIAVLSPGISTGGRIVIFSYNKNTSKWDSISSGLPSAADGIMAIALDDFDMDGKCDLAAWTVTSIDIYKGDGTGHFTANGSAPNPISGSYGNRGLATGDFNHDGYTDIASFNNTGANTLKVFLSNTTVHSLAVMPDFPHGQECFSSGSVQFVKWLASVPAGPKATVTIEFSSTGSTGPWSNVVTNAPNSGIFQWTVPALVSTNCFLKYTVTQGTNVSTMVMANAFSVGACNATTSTGEVAQNASDFVIVPNPVCNNGSVQFTLQTASAVELSIFDMMGKEVVVLANESMAGTSHNIRIPSENMQPGIYFCKMTAGGKEQTQKLIIVK